MKDVMSVSDMCKTYIEQMIKPHKLYEQKKLFEILQKHSNVFSHALLHDLSIYYDKLDGQINDHADWMKRMLDVYKYTDEHFKDVDAAFDSLEAELEKDGLI